MNGTGAAVDTSRRTDSALPHGPHSRSSERLVPASADDFRNELTACLTLVAPVGMTEEAKRDWLAVAWVTLQHLPADLLASGCKVARETCDHPSKVVPTIVAATKQSLAWREEASRERGEKPRLPSPDYISPAEASSILREFGLRAGTDHGA